MRAIVRVTCLCLALIDPIGASAARGDDLTLDNVPGEIIGGEGRDKVGVLKLISGFQVALFKGNARDFADLFADDADFTNWRDRAIHGRSNIYEHHINVFKGRPPTRTNNLLGYTVRFITPDVAASEIKWDNRHAPAADGTRQPDRDGVWVSVMTREGGKWYFKVVRNVMLNDGTKDVRLP